VTTSNLCEDFGEDLAKTGLVVEVFLMQKLMFFSGKCKLVKPFSLSKQSL
jgi:hypothetical protein